VIEAMKQDKSKMKPTVLSYTKSEEQPMKKVSQELLEKLSILGSGPIFLDGFKPS